MALIGQTKWLTAVYFNPVQMESGEAVAQSDEGEDGITSHATAEEAKRPEIVDETLLPGVGEGVGAESVTHTTKASPDNTIADEMFSQVQAFAVRCSLPPDPSGIF